METVCRCACAYILPSPSGLVCGLIPSYSAHPPSPSLSLSPSFPPSPTPSPPPCSSSPPRLPLAPAVRCRTRWLRTAPTRPYSRTRSDGEARVGVRVRREHILPSSSRSLPVRCAVGAVCIHATQGRWAWVRACMWEYGAHHARVLARDRGRVSVRMHVGATVFFLCRYGG
jgi:hypothetical protein